MRISRRLCGVLVCFVLLMLAACGSSTKPSGGTGSTDHGPNAGQNANQIVLVPGQAAPTQVTIKRGDTVEFTVHTGEPNETLCLGQNMTCASNPTGPSELTRAANFQVRPGQTRAVQFDKQGTYHVTSLSYSGVNITVTVE